MSNVVEIFTRRSIETDAKDDQVELRPDRTWVCSCKSELYYIGELAAHCARCGYELPIVVILEDPAA
jgi:hypothetical protein